MKRGWGPLPLPSQRSGKGPHRGPDLPRAMRPREARNGPNGNMSQQGAGISGLAENDRRIPEPC